VPARGTDQPATSRSSRSVKNGPAGRRARPAPPPRIVILEPQPVIDGGRYAPKRTAGEPVDVEATIFADGHDVLRAVVRWKAPGGRRWHEAPLTHIDADIDGDTWTGRFPVESLGRWQWTIEAWIDRFASWREELRR
jgi:starch synthase (maltosyl-transferring)